MDNLIKDSLEIEVIKKNSQVALNWKGKSVERLPEFFLIPFFNQILDEGADSLDLMILNFFHLTYMNSSTMNPIIMLIKRLQEKKLKCKVIYNRDLKWQKLTFSVLNVFVTPDGLLEIEEIHKDWSMD